MFSPQNSELALSCLLPPLPIRFLMLGLQDIWQGNAVFPNSRSLELELHDFKQLAKYMYQLAN